MENKQIRDTEVYAKHLDCNEPEEHAKVSIEYAIKMVTQYAMCADSLTQFVKKLKQQISQ